MTRNNLTETSKRRLDTNNICPICNELIEDDDELLFTIRRKRRCKQYIFYHKKCLINGIYSDNQKLLRRDKNEQKEKTTT